jgi:hypothetical protein
MMEVGGVEAQPELGTQQMEGVQEGEGIRPSGDGHDHGLSA